MSKFAIGSSEWPGMAKVIEECGELQQVLGKIIGCGGDFSLDWVVMDHRAKIVEEVADLSAAIQFFISENLDISEIASISNRQEEKLKLFRRWHADGTQKNKGI